MRNMRDYFVTSWCICLNNVFNFIHININLVLFHSCPFDISVGLGAFVIGLGQISSFLSLYLHLFPAAVWSVVTRFPASGCLKCHYSSHSSSDLVV